MSGQKHVDPRPRIGIVGTFDVANFGDRLLPMIARHELESRLGPVDLLAFSYHARTADSWGLDVTPLEHLPALLPSLHLLIVGGGDLIRFDTLVAPGYYPASPAVHHPTGFWLGPILAAHTAGVPVAWNAPGVPHAIPRWAQWLARTALGASSYVTVRDTASKDALASLDGIADIEVVPDSAFNAYVLLDGRRSEPSDPYVVMQSAPDCRSWLNVLAAERRDTRLQDHHYRVSLTPIAPALSDYTIAPRRLPPFARFIPPLDPLALLRLIAGSIGVVGTSLHLTLAALSAGIPAIRPAGGSLRKYSLLEGVDGVCTFNAATRLDRQAVQDMAPAPDALAEIRRRLNVHWDRMARLANRGAARAAPPPEWARVLDQVWAQLPAALEDRSTFERTRTAMSRVAGHLRRLRYNGRHG